MDFIIHDVFKFLQPSDPNANFNTLRDSVMSKTDDINLDALKTAVADIEKEKQERVESTGHGTGTEAQVESLHLAGIKPGDIVDKDKTDDKRIEEELASAMRESPDREESQKVLAPEKHVDHTVESCEGTTHSDNDSQVNENTKKVSIPEKDGANKETEPKTGTADVPKTPISKETTPANPNNDTKKDDQDASVNTPKPNEDEPKYPTQECGNSSDDDIYGPSDGTGDLKHIKEQHNKDMQKPPGVKTGPIENEQGGQAETGLFSMQQPKGGGPVTRSQTGSLPDGQSKVFGDGNSDPLGANSSGNATQQRETNIDSGQSDHTGASSQSSQERASSYAEAARTGVREMMLLVKHKSYYYLVANGQTARVRLCQNRNGNKKSWVWIYY